MASKKIAATVEEPMFKEMEERMAQEKFYETSEFVKHCIRQYLVKAPGGLMSTMMMSGSASGNDNMTSLV